MQKCNTSKRQKDHKKRYSLDENECKRFISLICNSDCNEDVKRLIIFLLYTGMRIGECLALSWDDIDFDGGVIDVNYTLSYADGMLFLETPKTASSLRSVGMCDTVKEILINQKHYCSELKYILKKDYNHPETVFPSGLGNYRDRHSVYVSLKRITEGTEFEDMTLHKLRHCNATLLINNGVDLKMVSENLGHSGVEITTNIYADVLKSQKKKMASILEFKLSDEENDKVS